MSEALALTSKLATISNAFTLEKRFKKNFDIISQIGIGGFAKVVKAKNHLDNMEYAIKKIKIDTRNKSAFEVVDELDQILTEIRCFAKIKHKHVVRYNHSWIEVKLKENQLNDQSFEENKLLKNVKLNSNQIKKNFKSKNKNSKKITKNKSIDFADKESSGVSCGFSDQSYGCEISWEGINKSDNFKSNEEEYKKLNKANEENYSFDSSFYLEEENDNLFFNCDKNEKIIAEYESEIPEFGFQAIGKIKNNKTLNKKYAMEVDETDSESEINFVKSISRINKISEDYNNELTNKNVKKNQNKNYLKAIIKSETDDLKIHINEKDYKFSQVKQFTIYLQMELCKQTLEDFLRQKLVSKKLTESLNPTKLFSNESSTIQKEVLEKLEIFLEITKAINYLHESENIIHRDIKPQNIFFSFDGNIKVGDFGLATSFYNEKYYEKENEKIRKNSLESKTTTVTHSSSPPNYSNNELKNKLTSNENCTFYHTKNIGTLLYSSPEQLNDNFYDYKSDIYSLGLILFELLNPFKTQMEKNMKFEEIRKGKIPITMHSDEPTLGKLVLSMCQQDPKLRPNTKEIIKILLKEISNKYFFVMESNPSEDAESLHYKEIEYKNYFNSSCKNLSVSSLNFNNEIEKPNNLFKFDNFVDIDLRKASSYETSDYNKLNCLKNTLKYVKKTEDFCVDITDDPKNSRIFSVKDFQQMKTKKLEKIVCFNSNINNTTTNNVNLNAEEIQNKRLRLLNTEIEANFNKENTNTQNILFGRGYFYERPYKSKDQENPEKLKFINTKIKEKNKIYLKMFENNLLIFHNEKAIQADKVFDLLESKVKITKNFKNKLTEILLEIPFVSNVSILMENSKENNEIIQKIKKENFID